MARVRTGVAIGAVLVVVLAVGVWLVSRGGSPSRPSDATSPSAPATTPSTTPTGSPPSPSSTAPSASLEPALPVKVGVYGSPGTWWPGNGITNVYLPADQNAAAFPLGRLRALLHQGTSLNITITTRETVYLAGIAQDDPVAVAWLTAYVENVGRLATFARTQANGAYVVATILHESAAQVNKGHVTGSSTDFATIGRVQQRTIALGRELAPDAIWSVWLVGHDRVDEGVQLAQVTDPKPDLISVDPYANGDCTDTLAGIAAEDLAWVRAQPAYAGRVAISETGMNARCSDDQLAAFYTDVPDQLRALGPDVAFYVMFNSDNGTFPHYVTDGAHPLAVAALEASLTRS